MAGKATNVQVGSSDLRYLERRGARSHRGGSLFSRSSVLSRALRNLAAVLEEADPRPRLPPAVYETAIGLLREGWLLVPMEVSHLDEVLAKAEGFNQSLGAAGIETKVFLDAILALPFVAKCALVDQAIQVHAPGAAVDEAEEL
jgi:hypothetical protein